MVGPAAKSIDLVHKNDAPLLALPRRREQLPYPLRPHPHEHLLQLRRHQLDELTPRLVRQRTCQHRFPRPWRTVEQYPPSDTSAHLFVSLRVLQKIYEFGKLLLDIFPPVVVVEKSIVRVQPTLELHIRYLRPVQRTRHPLERKSRTHAHKENTVYLLRNQIIAVGKLDALVPKSSQTYLMISYILEEDSLPRKVLNHYDV